MIPNLFKKEDIPKLIPNELKIKILEFSKTGNKEIFLKKSFFYIVNNWKSNRINFIFKFHRLFLKDLSKIIKTKGYMHCTTMNYILRVMAVKSGIFRDKDIKLVITNLWYIVPHQFLQIKLSNDEIINLDPWNYQFGTDFGKYSSGFSSVKFNPVR